jgi:hypothetical protein
MVDLSNLLLREKQGVVFEWDTDPNSEWWGIHQIFTTVWLNDSMNK